MREPGRFVTAIAIAGVAAIAATPSDAAGKKHSYMRSGAYDGLWSVSIRTKSGPCDAAYRYPARIVGGQIIQADNDFSYQISGAVVAKRRHRRVGEQRARHRHRLRPAARRHRLRPLERAAISAPAPGARCAARQDKFEVSGRRACSASEIARHDDALTFGQRRMLGDVIELLQRPQRHMVRGRQRSASVSPACADTAMPESHSSIGTFGG